MKKFSQGKDRLEQPAFAPPFSEDTKVLVLEAETGEVQAVPTGAEFVRITPSAAAYVRRSGEAVIPTVDMSGETAPILIGAGRDKTFQLEGAGTIGVISSSAAIVTLEFWS